jgi:hypothetical protein
VSAGRVGECVFHCQSCECTLGGVGECAIVTCFNLSYVLDGYSVQDSIVFKKNKGWE